MQYIMQARRLI